MWDKIRREIVAELDINDWTGLECWRLCSNNDSLENHVVVNTSNQKHLFKEHHNDCQKIWVFFCSLGKARSNPFSCETNIHYTDPAIYNSRRSAHCMRNPVLVSGYTIAQLDPLP